MPARYLAVASANSACPNACVESASERKRMSRLTRLWLRPRGQHQDSALFLPVISEGKAQLSGRVFFVNCCQILLEKLIEHLLVRNVAAVTLHFPVLRKSAQRNSRIVLHNYATV